MLEILTFIFSSFWIWLGTVILAVALRGIFRLFSITNITVKDNKLED